MGLQLRDQGRDEGVEGWCFPTDRAQHRGIQRGDRRIYEQADCYTNGPRLVQFCHHDLRSGVNGLRGLGVQGRNQIRGLRFDEFRRLLVQITDLVVCEPLEYVQR